MSITGFILISTCIFSYYCFKNPQARDKFIFNPYIIQEKRQWYRFFSSGMIHADWIHLLINMFVLYSFGGIVERYFEEVFETRATFAFILLYFGGMAISVAPTFSKHKTNPSYNALGASGAVSAVVFSFILFNPLHRLCLYGLLCLPGLVFGVGYLVYCYYAGKKGGDYINHDAHMWGAIYGFIFPLMLKPQLLPEFLNQLPFLHASF